MTARHGNRELQRTMSTVTITYVDCQGTERHVRTDVGNTVMETAVDNDVPGIDADCGGCCACATCHVYVDDRWLERLTPIDDMEASMLEFASEVRQNSRLACQLEVNESMDGLRVTTPESQG